MMPYFDYNKLYSQLETQRAETKKNNLQAWLDILPSTIGQHFNAERWGDIPKWMQAYNALPDIRTASIQLDQSVITIGDTNDVNEKQAKQLESNLRVLHPWRKGPFQFFGLDIDTEWRSDWKWDRLKDKIEPLKGKTVLDVGCGSGYHCWRMRGADAALVIGIEPTPLFNVQFHAAQKYIQDDAVHVVPARMEDLPAQLQAFDTVFSMGILYHRRSPIDHLLELKDCLKSGGQLVLETLVIEGQLGDTLVPEGRYAKMGNVWFIPSCDTLALWLKKTGYQNIQCIDVTDTSIEEQRQTDWMTFHSLQHFLDPSNDKKTIEGYPAPRRAIFIATK